MNPSKSKLEAKTWIWAEGRERSGKVRIDVTWNWWRRWRDFFFNQSVKPRPHKRFFFPRRGEMRVWLTPNRVGTGSAAWLPLRRWLTPNWRHDKIRTNCITRARKRSLVLLRIKCRNEKPKQTNNCQGKIALTWKFHKMFFFPCCCCCCCFDFRTKIKTNL